MNHFIIHPNNCRTAGIITSVLQDIELKCEFGLEPISSQVPSQLADQRSKLQNHKEHWNGVRHRWPANESTIGPCFHSLVSVVRS